MKVAPIAAAHTNMITKISLELPHPDIATGAGLEVGVASALICEEDLFFGVGTGLDCMWRFKGQEVRSVASTMRTASSYKVLGQWYNPDVAFATCGCDLHHAATSILISSRDAEV